MIFQEVTKKMPLLKGEAKPSAAVSQTCASQCQFISACVLYGLFGLSIIVYMMSVTASPEFYDTLFPYFGSVIVICVSL